MSAERPREDEGRPGVTGLIAIAFFVVVLAAMILTVPALRAAAGDAVSGDTEALRENLDSATGALTLLVLALMHTVVFYPAEILDTAAGFVWGFWLGLALVMAGWLVNAWAAWEIGRRAARPLLYRAFGRERFLRYQDAVQRGGVPLLLGIRVVPIIPFSLFTIVIGAAGVPLVRMLWTTAIGYLPITALFVYLGSQLEELSPTDPVLILGAGGIVLAIYAGHRLRGRFEGPGAGPAPPSDLAAADEEADGASVGGELAGEREPDRDDLLGV